MGIAINHTIQPAVAMGLSFGANMTAAKDL